MLEIKYESGQTVSFVLSNLHRVLMQSEGQATFVLIQTLITHDKILKAQLHY